MVINIFIFVDQIVPFSLAMFKIVFQFV